MLLGIYGSLYKNRNFNCEIFNKLNESNFWNNFTILISPSEEFFSSDLQGFFSDDKNQLSAKKDHFERVLLIKIVERKKNIKGNFFRKKNLRVYIKDMYMCLCCGSNVCFKYIHHLRHTSRNKLIKFDEKKVCSRKHVKEPWFLWFSSLSKSSQIWKSRAERAKISRATSWKKF